MIITDKKVYTALMKINSLGYKLGNKGMYSYINRVLLFAHSDDRKYFSHPSYDDADNGFHFGFTDDVDKLEELSEINMYIDGKSLNALDSDSKYNHKNYFECIEITDDNVIIKFSESWKSEKILSDKRTQTFKTIKVNGGPFEYIIPRIKDDNKDTKTYSNLLKYMEEYDVDYDSAETLKLSDELWVKIKDSEYPYIYKTSKYRVRLMKSLFRSPTKDNSISITIAPTSTNDLFLNIITIERSKTSKSIHVYFNLKY